MGDGCAAATSGGGPSIGPGGCGPPCDCAEGAVWGGTCGGGPAVTPPMGVAKANARSVEIIRGALRRDPRTPLPGSSGVLESDMRSAEPSVRLLQLPVDDGGDPHAVANAEGDRTVTKISAFQFIQARGEQHRSRRTQRMAQSDCASVNVDPVHIDPELAGDDHGDRREGLVDLPEVDVRDLEAGTSERLPRRG